MRKRDSYIKKYKDLLGSEAAADAFYRRLQREAGLASAHARAMKKLGLK